MGFNKLRFWRKRRVPSRSTPTAPSGGTISLSSYPQEQDKGTVEWKVVLVHLEAPTAPIFQDYPSYICFEGNFDVGDALSCKLRIQNSIPETSGAVIGFRLVTSDRLDQVSNELHIFCKVALADICGNRLMEDREIYFQGRNYEAEFCSWDTVLRNVHTIHRPLKQCITVMVAYEIFAKLSMSTNQPNREKSPTPSDNVLPKILADEINPDIILKADGVEFKAHMSILAGNSDVFSRKFETEMAGKRDRTVEMEDMTSGALDAFLKYLYSRDTARIKKDIKIAAALLQAAYKYNILGLSEICERAVLSTEWEFMSVDEGLDVFVCGSLLNKLTIEYHGLRALRMKREALGTSPYFRHFVNTLDCIRNLHPSEKLAENTSSKHPRIKIPEN